MTHLPRGHRLAATVLVLGTMLVACEGGDDDDAGGTTIETTATEFAFDPSSWTVEAGEEFTVDLTNGGALEHEWVVIELGEDITSEDEFTDDIVLLEVEAIPAGESTTESFTIDEAGTYQVICGIPTHFDAGMEGSLTVS
ncbi:MAG: cupredoxin domain-containing protein [Actinobacteria bacterium]|nr:cupredoxin domain-containing protein [Actinomycetota bacterium]